MIQVLIMKSILVILTSQVLPKYLDKDFFVGFTMVSYIYTI